MASQRSNADECVSNHNDCTPWYKTSTDANTHSLARVSMPSLACASTPVPALFARHHAAAETTEVGKYCFHCNEDYVGETYIRCDKCGEIMCRFCVRHRTPNTGCWRWECEVNSLPTLYRVARFQTPVTSFSSTPDVARALTPDHPKSLAPGSDELPRNRWLLAAMKASTHR